MAYRISIDVLWNSAMDRVQLSQCYSFKLCSLYDGGPFI